MFVKQTSGGGLTLRVATPFQLTLNEVIKTLTYLSGKHPSSLVRAAT